MRGAVRRWSGVVLVLVLVVGGVLLIRLSGKDRPDSATGSTTESSTSAPSSSAPSTSAPSTSAPSSSAPSSSTATPDTANSANSANSADGVDGPGITTDGINLVAQPDSAGNLQVIEQIRLAVPVTALSVRAPRPPIAALAGTDPRIADLQAAADSEVIGKVPDPDADGVIRIRFARPHRVISLRYLLEGTALHTQPSPVGRVLVTVGPISAAGVAASTPVVLEVGGTGALNLVCPQLPASRQVCGVTEPQLLVAGPVRADRSSMVAQLQLTTG